MDLDRDQTSDDAWQDAIYPFLLGTILSVLLLIIILIIAIQIVRIEMFLIILFSLFPIISSIDGLRFATLFRGGKRKNIEFWPEYRRQALSLLEEHYGHLSVVKDYSPIRLMNGGVHVRFYDNSNKRILFFRNRDGMNLFVSSSMVPEIPTIEIIFRESKSPGLSHS